MNSSKVGQILNLFISNSVQVMRQEKISLKVDERGIIEDKYYNRNVERSILVTSLESYHLVEKHNISMPFGSLGENLLIDYNPYHLNAGQRLQIGEVILEISQNCTICEHLSSIDNRLPKLLEKDRGIFAKIIQGGSINQGESISLLD